MENTHFTSEETGGNQERQNKAFLVTPKNRDVLQRQPLSSSPTPISTPSASARRLAVSSSSLLQISPRFDEDDVGDVEFDVHRRGRTKRRSARRKLWRKMMKVFNALKIGMMRLLAPEVS